MKKITVLIVEDHRLVRESLVLIFDADERFEMAGECSSGEEAIELSALLKPEILLMDVNLPGIDGMETTRKILSIHPTAKIIGMSMHVRPEVSRQMFKAGVMGYVTKNSSSDELMKAAIEVYNNRKYICAEIKEIIAGHVMGSMTPAPLTSRLTKREMEIIVLLKKGYTSGEIAKEHFLALKTVEKHRYNILKKLKLPNVASLINYMYQVEQGVV